MSIARRMQMGAAGVSAGGGDGWTDPDLANASYDSVSLNISAVSGTASDGVQVGDSGLKIYVTSNTNDSIHQWNLSLANDLTSASYHGAFSTTSQTTNTGGVFFKTDGSKMYVADNVFEDIYQYSLSTAWDVTTASYDSKSFSPTESNVGTGIFISTDGANFYYENYSTETTYQYSLSTAWDISTASYDSKSFTSTEAADTYGIFFNPDGDKLYKISITADAVYQYSLSTAWDVSTASYDSISFSVASQASLPADFCFGSDGSKMFVVDTATPDTIYQYSTA